MDSDTSTLDHTKILLNVGSGPADDTRVDPRFLQPPWRMVRVDIDQQPLAHGGKRRGQQDCQQNHQLHHVLVTSEVSVFLSPGHAGHRVRLRKVDCFQVPDLNCQVFFPVDK